MVDIRDTSIHDTRGANGNTHCQFQRFSGNFVDPVHDSSR